MRTRGLRARIRDVMGQLYSSWKRSLLKYLSECVGCTGEYWSEVVTVRTERQYSPVWLEQVRLVSSLLFGTRVMLILNLPAFENKKYATYDPSVEMVHMINPDQKRTNQNIQISLKATLPYNNTW